MDPELELVGDGGGRWFFFFMLVLPAFLPSASFLTKITGIGPLAQPLNPPL